MNFELVSLDGVKFKATAYSVILPTASGQITVLPNHEPLMSVLKPGIITIRRDKNDPDNRQEQYAVYGGVVEISREGARVLVDEATHGEEVNEAEAQKAHDEAVRLRDQAKNQVELDRAQSLVDRQSARLELAKIRRRHQRRG